MLLKTVTFTLPAHWACYLFNGDAAYLDDSELAIIEGFMERENIGPALSLGDDTFFAHWHDAFHLMPLGADCAEYVFGHRPC